MTDAPDTHYALVSGYDDSYEIHCLFEAESDAQATADALGTSYRVEPVDHWPIGTRPPVRTEWTAALDLPPAVDAQPRLTSRNYLGTPRPTRISHGTDRYGRAVSIHATGHTRDEATNNVRAEAARYNLDRYCLDWRQTGNLWHSREWCLLPENHGGDHWHRPFPMPQIRPVEQSGAVELVLFGVPRLVRTGPTDRLVLPLRESGPYLVYEPSLPVQWHGPLLNQDEVAYVQGARR